MRARLLNRSKSLAGERPGQPWNLTPAKTGIERDTCHSQMIEISYQQIPYPAVSREMRLVALEPQVVALKDSRACGK